MRIALNLITDAQKSFSSFCNDPERVWTKIVTKVFECTPIMRLVTCWEFDN